MTASNRVVKCAIVIYLAFAGVLISSAQVNKYENSSNYRSALSALDNDDVKTGYDYLMKEIAVHPDNGYAYLYLSTIFLEYEDHTMALGCINESIKYLPSKDKQTLSRALTIRAGIKRAIDQNDSALSDLNEALALCPKDLEILQERADLYYKLEKYDKSDSDYKRILGIQPGYAIAEMGLGRNNVGRKKYTEAITQFNKIARKFPDYSQVFAFRAEAYLGLGKTSEAIDDIIRAIEIDQNNKAIILMAFINQDSSDLLFNKFSRKQESDKNNPLWPLYLGTIKEMNEEYTLAISYYKNSYKTKATPLCARRIADCYKELREWDNALLYIDKAISLGKDDLRYLAEKASILWYADRLNEAIAVETKCIEAQPNYYFHYYRRGWYRDLIGDVDGALEDYTECLSKNPDYAYAHLNRGRLYLQRGYKQMAQSDFEACVKLDSIPGDNSCAHYAFFYLGKNSEAKAFMDKALEEDPEGSYYDAACLYSLMDLKSTALDYLEKAYESGFNNFNHILRDHNLDNIRGEYRFKQLYEKYSNQTLVTQSTSGQEPETRINRAPESSVETTYIEKTISIPFTSSYGITKVKGTINDYDAVFSYIPGQKIAISAYQAEYYLSNGYINKSDCSAKIGADGKIPVGSTIKFSSITIGDELFTNIKVRVVDNNQVPLVFGDKLFGANSKVRKDDKRSVISVSRTIKSY